VEIRWPARSRVRSMVWVSSTPRLLPRRPVDEGLLDSLWRSRDSTRGAVRHRCRRSRPGRRPAGLEFASGRSDRAPQSAATVRAHGLSGRRSIAGGIYTTDAEQLIGLRLGTKVLRCQTQQACAQARSTFTYGGELRSCGGQTHAGGSQDSIGPVTSATARKYGLEVAVEASPYTIEGLAAAIVGSH